jgi:hypothetical protein
MTDKETQTAEIIQVEWETRTDNQNRTTKAIGTFKSLKVYKETRTTLKVPETLETTKTDKESRTTIKVFETLETNKTDKSTKATEIIRAH